MTRRYIFLGWETRDGTDEARTLERGSLRTADAGVPSALCGERRAADGRQDLVRGRGAAPSARPRDGEARARWSCGDQRGKGGRIPPRPTAQRGNPARRRGGCGGPARDHLLHHAAASLRRGPPLRPARRLARGPERHPRTPRVSEPCRLLLPGSALPPLVKTYLLPLTIRCGLSILSLFQ